MVSTATTGTPCSTPNTSNTLIQGPPQASTGYMAGGTGPTQTYHIFLPTSQPQVAPYGLPTGGLLQPAPAIPGYPMSAGYFNIGMMPQATEWLQPNYKSSNRGNHNSNYKGRGRGGRGGPSNDRNTPVGSSGPPQGSFAPTNSYQPYQQTVAQLPYSQYQGGQQQYGQRRQNHNNWETSSQHSNSSQKKFSSSSSSGHDSGSGVVPGVGVVSPQAAPRLVQQPVAVQYAPQPATQFLPQSAVHPHHQPRPSLPKDDFPGGVGQYQPYHHHQPRNLPDTIQTKEYVSKRGRGGRGGSSRGGRDEMSGGYNNSSRGAHTAGAPPGGAPARNVVYHQGRHNSGGGPGGVIPGPQDVTAPQPRPEPPRPAPEFNMETNDFPALPGAPAPPPAADPTRFLDVVKGTAKIKLDDDQETLPEELCNSLYEDGQRASMPEIGNDSSAVLSPKSRSKSSSVSETPVVSVERSGGEEEVVAVAAPLVNGEVKMNSKSSVPVVSINANTDRESGSVSPRQQSLDSGQKLTYAQIIQKKKEAAEALERERAAAAAAGQPLEPKGTKDEKAEKTVEVDVGAVKEATTEAKADHGHAVVERQDSRSKHRPLAKAASGGGPQSAPAEKSSPQGSKGVGGSPNSATVPPSGGAPSPVSATPPTSKQQGKRTERPKTPPAQGGGGPGQK